MLEVVCWSLTKVKIYKCRSAPETSFVYSHCVRDEQTTYSQTCGSLLKNDGCHFEATRCWHANAYIPLFGSLAVGRGTVQSTQRARLFQSVSLDQNDLESDAWHKASLSALKRCCVRPASTKLPGPGISTLIPCLTRREEAVQRS